jgi:cytochrome P450
MNLQTTVATQNLTIHRDPKTFDNPDNFDPERWLKNGHDKLKEALTPFSVGPRKCIGSK